MAIAIPFPLVGTQEKEKEKVTTGAWRWVTLGRRRRRLLWMHDGAGLKRLRFLCEVGARPVIYFEPTDTDWVDTLLFYKYEKDRKPCSSRPLDAGVINYKPNDIIEIHLLIGP